MHIGKTLAMLLAGSCAGAYAAGAPFDAGTISGLGARNIGSAAMSGRISAIAAVNDPSGKLTLLVGAASGGVWKSLDGGTTFKPVFDEQPVQSIGAIAIDPENPQNVWVGSGESWTRNSVSVGDGVYKSSDGGETWKNVGLPQSERIAKIIVDPRNSDTVYVCVPGKLWSDSADRGLYKTSDGGASWQLILKGANLSTGCSTLALDPQNPDVLLAGLWDFRRKGWTFRSGGEGPDAFSGSGLYRTVDGGKTWTELTPDANQGFPKKPYGRIAVAIAPSDARTVYAFVESTDSALMISHDGGQTWEAGDKSQWMVWRPFYFANLIVDPKDPKRLFKTDGALISSSDGGKSFSAVGGFNGAHGDVHDLWIDPANPQHVINGDDGGLWISYDGGNKWWKSDNLPVSQFYHVSLDGQDPYHVYGGLQDNGSWRAASEYPGGIASSQWENFYGGDGFWMFPDPSDPDYLYGEYQGGSIGRVNVKTHETRDIQPKLGAAELKQYKKLRWNWNAPIALSPSDRNTLYIGSQFLFRSHDHGQTWQRISPDLTSNDPDKQKQEESGGVTVDNSAAETHTTIYSICESPKNAQTIWVGTDDGKLQLTRDGGRNWSNVVDSVPQLPPGSWVSWVQASAHDAASAYAAFDRHTFGDLQPYVYVTHDYGRSWAPLVSPEAPKGVRGYAHVIKEDPLDRQLLYLGTEFGLWISVDGGQHWAPFKGGHFPAVAVRDLAVHPRTHDLVLATHGRGIWIVDDITPLRHLDDQVLAQEAAFLEARPVQQRIESSVQTATGAASFIGDNPQDGAVITYYQRTRHLFGRLKLEVFDANGKLVDELPASTRRGLNRVLWTMRVKPPQVPPAAQLAFYSTQGPRVLPGVYTVRMTKNGKVYETSIRVGLDRRAVYTLADRRQQFDAAMQVHALFGRESALFGQIAGLREALAQSGAGDDAELGPKLKDFDGKLDAVRKQIVATKEGGAITGEERLREHTDQLYGAILSWDGRPGDYLLANTAALRGELQDIERQFRQLTTGELPALNEALKTRGKQPLMVPAETAESPAGGPGSGRGTAVHARDPDAAFERVHLPKDLRLSY
jgi:photosystem II stability/assembly factor-like uncharacterized protein